MSQMNDATANQQRLEEEIRVANEMLGMGLNADPDNGGIPLDTGMGNGIGGMDDF